MILNLYNRKAPHRYGRETFFCAEPSGLGLVALAEPVHLEVSSERTKQVAEDHHDDPSARGVRHQDQFMVEQRRHRVVGRNAKRDVVVDEVRQEVHLQPAFAAEGHRDNDGENCIPTPSQTRIEEHGELPLKR